MALPAALVLVLLHAGPEARLLEDEVSAGVGLLGAGVTASAGALRADTLFTAQLGGRLVWGGPTAEAGLLLALPLASDGAATALSAAVRVGWTGERWSVLVGAVLQWAYDGRPPVSVLPTLRAAYDFGPFGLSAGVLDLLGLVPAHLSVEVRREGVAFAVGWVAPLGLLSSLEVPLAGAWRLRVTGFAYRLFQADFAFLSAALVLGGGR